MPGTQMLTASEPCDDVRCHCALSAPNTPPMTLVSNESSAQPTPGATVISVWKRVHGMLSSRVSASVWIVVGEVTVRSGRSTRRRA